MTQDSHFDAQIRAALLESPELDDEHTRDALATVLGRSRTPSRRRLGPVAVIVSAAAVAAAVVVPVLVLNRDDAPPAVTQPTAGQQLIGSWRHTVGPGQALAGDWLMNLGDDGVMALDAPPSATVGTDGISYAATDGTIRLDAFINDLCAELPAGIYRWSVSATQLRLTVVDDGCEPRAGLFAGTWTRADPA